MKVKKRHQAIKELIKSHHIEDQQMLIDLMEKEYGIETSQPIVSRDLRILNVIKRPIDANRTIYDLPETDVVEEILKLAVVKIMHNQSMIAVHTLPALADFVGDYLDAHGEIGIMATLAGENVVFVSPVDTNKIAELVIKLEKILHIKTPFIKDAL